MDVSLRLPARPVLTIAAIRGRAGGGGNEIAVDEAEDARRLRALARAVGSRAILRW
jgi:hypothetical protein